MPDNTPSIVRFNGVHPLRLDEKRRVCFPHSWRGEKGEPFFLVIWPKNRAGTCLRGLTQFQMEKTIAQIDAMPEAESRTVLKRNIGSNSVLATVDSAGRVAIPENMVEAANLGGKDALFVGLTDRFEIWNPQRYEAIKAQDAAVLHEALRMLE